MLGPADQVAALACLLQRLENSVKLQQLAVALADFIFDVAVPEIGSEAERAVRLFVQGYVIGAFQLYDVIALGFVFVLAAGFGVLEQG